jgi:hypothetical protein
MTSSMRITRCLLVATALLGSSWACSGSDSSASPTGGAAGVTGETGGSTSGAGGAATGTGGATGAGGVTASTWLSDRIAAHCAWAVRCGQFQDAAACEAFMGPEFAVDSFNTPSAAIAAVSAGTAQFDPTQAASCLTALSKLSSCRWSAGFITATCEKRRDSRLGWSSRPGQSGR